MFDENDEFPPMPEPGIRVLNEPETRGPKPKSRSFYDSLMKANEGSESGVPPSDAMPELNRLANLYLDNELYMGSWQVVKWGDTCKFCNKPVPRTGFETVAKHFDNEFHLPQLFLERLAG
jgi:hypothetical protein